MLLFGRRLLTVLLPLLVLLLSVASHATLIIGSFERGPDADRFAELAEGTDELDGWEVFGDGGVDYIISFWEASDGEASLDLIGTSPGGVFQTIETIEGMPYRVTFDIAGNPGGEQGIKTLLVSAGDASGEYSFDTTGRSKTDMGWESRVFEFTALGTSTVLQFEAIAPETGPWGPALDNVSLILMPEPHTALLLAGGLMVLGLRRNRA